MFSSQLVRNTINHKQALPVKSNVHRVLKQLRHIAMGAEFSVLNKCTQHQKMALLSIVALISFVAEEKKSIERGENHYRSEHIESFNYHQCVLRGEVHASMKKKVYKVTVSLLQIRAIDRVVGADVSTRYLLVFSSTPRI